METKRRIEILPPVEAQKIAAGEVIERPASLVREFIDNSIDAGSTLIEVSIDEGGTRCTEVSDNGCGIDREDLALCYKTYATSKIRNIEDLRRARTLGFRGEALSAAAAVAHLEILSSTDGINGSLLLLSPGKKDAIIENASRRRGTSVRAFNIFCNIPARKHFLKRPWHEAAMCRQTFNDKALAFPELGFKLREDGAQKVSLPPANSHKERFAQVMTKLTSGEKGFLHQISTFGEGFSITIVVGGPEVFRPHRRSQFIFANGRRINDYGFQQALEYGTQGAFPNSSHPVGAIFIDVEPQLADFNIHPAKREARFTCEKEIHHAISDTLRSHFRQIMLKKRDFTNGFERNEETFPPHQRRGESADWGREDIYSEDENTGAEALFDADAREDGGLDFAARLSLNSLTSKDEIKDEGVRGAGGVRFVGTAFDFFILVETDGRLFAIDQHAAHERLLYESLISKPVDRQELLTPFVFETPSPADDEFLEREKERFEKLGVILKREHNKWIIEALPVLWKMNDADTVREILNLQNAGENIAQRWASNIACHSAIKDGEKLDSASALTLAKEALKLDIQACPHGRPILFELKKEHFLRAVRRTY